MVMSIPLWLVRFDLLHHSSGLTSNRSVGNDEVSPRRKREEVQNLDS